MPESEPSLRPAYAPADNDAAYDGDDAQFEPEVSLAEFARTILWMAGLAAIAIGFNAVSLAGAFVDQDAPRITQNLAIRTWAGLSVIWRLPHQFPDFSPLTYTLHLVEARVWGIQGERVAMWYRAVNVLIHAGSVLLLFQLLRRLAVPGAFAAAALFAVHPANATAVAWIAQRPVILGTFFGVATLFVLLRVTGINQRPADAHRFLRLPGSPLGLWTIAAVLTMLTASAAPALAAALAPLLLTIAWWRRGRIGRRDWLAAAPMIALTLLVLIGALLLAARRAPPWEPIGLDGVPAWQRPTAAVMQFAWYLATAVLPFRLQFAHRPFEIGLLSASAAWAGVALLIAGATWAAKRGRRGPAAALIAFFILLAPALIWIGQDQDLYGGWVAAHLLYPATAAVIVAVVSPIAAWLERLGHGFDRRGFGSLSGVATALSIAAIGAFAVERGYSFGSQRRLWADTLEKDPTNLVATVRSGSTAMAENDWGEAERLFRAANRLDPRSPLPLVMLGELYERRSGTETSLRARARDAFIAALALDPNNYDAICGKARALQAMGDSAAALAEYERARRLRPRDPMLFNNIGLAYFERGESAKSEEAYRTALSLDPRCTAARINLANLLYQQGRVEAAATELLRAVEIDPNSWEAYMNAGAMLGQMRDFPKAARLFRAAVFLKKDSAEAYGNLGMALIGWSDQPGVAPPERLGMLGEAAFCFERASALNPQNPLYAQTLQQVKRRREALLSGTPDGR